MRHAASHPVLSVCALVLMLSAPVSQAWSIGVPYYRGSGDVWSEVPTVSEDDVLALLPISRNETKGIGKMVYGTRESHFFLYMAGYLPGAQQHTGQTHEMCSRAAPMKANDDNSTDLLKPSHPPILWKCPISSNACCGWECCDTSYYRLWYIAGFAVLALVILSAPRWCRAIRAEFNGKAPPYPSPLQVRQQRAPLVRQVPDAEPVMAMHIRMDPNGEETRRGVILAPSSIRQQHYSTSPGAVAPQMVSVQNSWLEQPD